jgi:hypothetical protein
MFKIFDKDSGNLLGKVTSDQLQFLIDQLEEESKYDQDYWLNRHTLETFAAKGCPAELLDFLSNAMGERQEMEIRWESE